MTLSSVPPTWRAPISADFNISKHVKKIPQKRGNLFGSKIFQILGLGRQNHFAKSLLMANEVSAMDGCTPCFMQGTVGARKGA